MGYEVRNAPAVSRASRKGVIPKVIVLHHTGGSGNEKAEIAYLQKNPANVSIHVCIAKDGTRYRMVADEEVAYHVGYSKVGSLGLPNVVSLGIELINTGSKKKPDPWPTAQVDSCGEQVAEWLMKYPTIEMVTSHAGIDTRGKYDPWLFPWDTFWGAVGRRVGGVM